MGIKKAGVDLKIDTNIFQREQFSVRMKIDRPSVVHTIKVNIFQFHAYIRGMKVSGCHRSLRIYTLMRFHSLTHVLMLD